MAEIQARLKGKLDEWMASQGDLGRETEERALLRQGKFKDMTFEEAVDAWQKKGRGKKNTKQNNVKKNKKKAA